MEDNNVDTSTASNPAPETTGRKKLTDEEKKQKAIEDKKKVLAQRAALQARLNSLDIKEKQINDKLGIVEEAKQAKEKQSSRKKRTHRLVKFAACIETVFGTNSASDLLFEIIKDNSTDIKKIYDERLAASEAEEAERKVAELEKKLAEKNSVVQAKIAEMQKPGADLVTLASDVRRLGNEVKKLSDELSDVRKKLNDTTNGNTGNTSNEENSSETTATSDSSADEDPWDATTDNTSEEDDGMPWGESENPF